MIGKGTFGEVYKVNGNAVKHFKRPHHFLQEIVVTKYLSPSNYVVNCVSYDIDKLEMTMELYDTSLRSAMVDYELNEDHKRKIFHDILYGVCNMHTMEIIHCDLKHSNILVNMSPVRAVICDLGLSSSTMYGKVHQTAPGYRLPDDMVSHKNGHYHDRFSLAICGYELFGDVRIKKRMTPLELEACILGNDRIPKDISEVLIEFTKEHSTICPSVRSALIRLYNVDAVMAIPSVSLYPNTLPPGDDRRLYNMIKSMNKTKKINRAKRVYYVLKNMFNDRRRNVQPEEYPLYVISMFMIMSSLFGPSGFGYHSVPSNRWSMQDIHRTLKEIIDDQVAINYIMQPS
jgi:serine/threonine protein kinase